MRPRQAHGRTHDSCGCQVTGGLGGLVLFYDTGYCVSAEVTQVMRCTPCIVCDPVPRRRPATTSTIIFAMGANNS